MPVEQPEWLEAQLNAQETFAMIITFIAAFVLADLTSYPDVKDTLEEGWAEAYLFFATLSGVLYLSSSLITVFQHMTIQRVWHWNESWPTLDSNDGERLLRLRPDWKPDNGQTPAQCIWQSSGGRFRIGRFRQFQVPIATVCYLIAIMIRINGPFGEDNFAGAIISITLMVLVMTPTIYEMQLYLEMLK